MKYVRTVVDIFIFPIVVFLLHAFLMVFFNIYAYCPDFDIPMHMLGGASVAVAYLQLYAILNKKRYVPKLRPFVLSICVMSLVVTTAVFWEWWEFLMDYFFPQFMMQLNLQDTMGDLLNGLIGGLAVILVCLRKKK